MSRRVLLPLLAMALVTACAPLSSGVGTTAGAQLRVIAGENFWGSLARQLGGARTRVQSVVSDPSADSHEYESSGNDARALADADLVILNGAGYDGWADKILAANPSPHRMVLVAAVVAGKKAGDNPHLWYDPATVLKVADAITANYSSLRPADAAYFQGLRAGLAAAMKPYLDRISEIRGRFAGARVGATENVFSYMATALGLALISPPEFMQAVGEGNDPPAAAVAEFQAQLSGREIRALVYNVQTATSVTTNLRHLAAQAGIPVVGVSETLRPESATFQDWQLSQLIILENALISNPVPR